MSPAKRFLIILAAIALAVWLGINLVLGPPGLTRAYMDQYKLDHERYIEIIKSAEYKRYAQRPALHAPEPGSALESRFNFAASYEARPEYVEEQKRIHLYELLFEFFNAALVLAVALRFGKAPLLNFLDQGLQELRERLDLARSARDKAAERRDAAETKIAQLPEEEMRIAAQTEQRLEKELAELGVANYYSLGIKERELNDRKQAVAYAAQMQIRRELVDRAIRGLIKELEAHAGETPVDGDVERFLAELERSG